MRSRRQVDLALANYSNIGLIGYGSPVLSGFARAQADTQTGWIAIALVFLAVVFNAGLSIVNAHVIGLSQSAVIGCEVVIVAAVHLLVLWNYRPSMLPWYAMMVFVVLFALFRTSVVGHFEPKYVRDVLLIPTFILLGMTVPIKRVVTLILALHAVVVGCALFEAIFPETYASIFEVRQYYVATRFFDDLDFWNASSDLFVSATRPDERFFSFVDIHRVSSVFLEPVSLGNYVIIITAFMCAFYRHLSAKKLAFLAIGSFIALVACDGRLATVASIIIVAVTAISVRLPRGTALLYLPAALIVAIIAAGSSNASWEDTFSGRITFCVRLLGQYDVVDWLGLSDRFVNQSFDSGIAYAIATQSVIGVALFWTFLAAGADESRPEQTRYLHALCTYLALTMLISYSIFSIKTAALLWFIHGSLQSLRSPIANRPHPAHTRS